MQDSTTKNEVFQYLDTRNKLRQDYEIEATYYYSVIDNYGADADGNRGTEASFLEDFEFRIYNDLGEEITDNIKEKDSDLFRSIENDVEARALGVDIEYTSF